MANPSPVPGVFDIPSATRAAPAKPRRATDSFFNAPIVSDTERHGPARNDATYSDLVEVCEKLAVDAQTHCIVPAWGPDALNPLVPVAGLESADETVRRLLAELISRNAIPTLSRHQAIAPLVRGKSRTAIAGASRIRRKERAAEARKYRFVVPIPTWHETGSVGAIEPTLSIP